MVIINNNSYTEEEIRAEQILNTEIDNFYKYLNDYKTKEYNRWFQKQTTITLENEKHSSLNDGQYLKDLAMTIGYNLDDQIYSSKEDFFTLQNTYNIDLCLSDFDKTTSEKYENILRSKINKIGTAIQQ